MPRKATTKKPEAAKPTAEDKIYAEYVNGASINSIANSRDMSSQEVLDIITAKEAQRAK